MAATSTFVSRTTRRTDCMVPPTLPPPQVEPRTGGAEPQTRPYSGQWSRAAETIRGHRRRPVVSEPARLAIGSAVLPQYTMAVAVAPAEIMVCGGLGGGGRVAARRVVWLTDQTFTSRPGPTWLRQRGARPARIWVAAGRPPAAPQT